MNYKFERELPLENKTTSGFQRKHLEPTEEYYDCLTSADIRRTVKLIKNENNECCKDN